MSSSVTEEERRVFRENFDAFDANGDGRLDIKELATALRSLGFHMTEKDVEQVHQEADKDGSGYIEFNEFLQLITTHMKEPYTKEELQEAFNIFDEDKSGTINAAELKNVLMQTGDKMKASEIDEIIQEADTNGDGVLDINEFANLLIYGQKAM